MLKTSTAASTTSCVNKWAKIFTIKEKAFNNVDWYNKQIVFKVFQLNYYQGYNEEMFTLVVQNTSLSSASNIALVRQAKADNRKKSRYLNCCYIQTGDIIDVYVNGISDGVPVHIEVLFSPFEGAFDFHYASKFIELENHILATSNKKDIELTFQNDWAQNNDCHSDLSYVDGQITIQFCCKSGQLSNDTTASILIAKISDGIPNKTIFNVCAYKDRNDNTNNVVPCAITNDGDILAFITKPTDRLYINFTYSI